LAGELLVENQLTRAVILPEHVAGVDRCLQRLLDESLATCALLLDRSGQMVSAQGDGCREVTVLLGALVAGSFASGREIARLLGEEHFQTLFQQGQQQHIMTTAVGGRWLLSVIFGNKTPVGLVKVLSNQAVEELSGILQDVDSQSDLREAPLGRSFRLSAAQAIDALFGEA